MGLDYAVSPLEAFLPGLDLAYKLSALRTPSIHATP